MADDIYSTDGNLVLPAGELYWDPEDDAGNLTGEVYLGNTPAFTNPVSNETAEHWSADTPVAERDEAVTRQVTRNITFTGDNISPFLLSLFYLADVSVKTQTAGSETAAPINGGRALVAGRSYQLGQDVENPSGVRNVSDVAINSDGTAAVEGTDYTLDAAHARITVLAGGALEGNSATSDHTLAADERAHIVAGALGSKKGALRYLATQQEGPHRDIYIPRILLTPNGEAAWKDRENWQSLQFSGMVLTRRVGGVKLPQVIIDGQAVAAS